MNYTEVTVRTTTEGAELVSDVMWEFSPYGVAIYDKNDIFDLAKTNKSWDYVDEDLLDKSPVVLVKGYLGKEEDLRALLLRLDNLKKTAPFLGSLETVTAKVDGDEWLEKWKEHFRPIPFEKVVICPEWIGYVPKAGESVVKLDSNMAFGTGEHETTAMCIELLQEYLSTGDVVLDVGCGSGILGISAEKLGASSVVMTDIDPCAVKSAKHNCEINRTEHGQVFQKNLLDDSEIKGNLILANIMAEILIAFSADIGNNLLPGGTVILSGILKDKLTDVLSAYAKNGFFPDRVLEKGEWCAVALKQK